ncbi:unnamed protein product [Amoebophrya sp. A120]|nr:unnamed protein product [Amoebophrya sp. A120]|eukprot:GSA120T00015031001.1
MIFRPPGPRGLTRERWNERGRVQLRACRPLPVLQSTRQKSWSSFGSHQTKQARRKKSASTAPPAPITRTMTKSKCTSGLPTWHSTWLRFWLRWSTFRLQGHGAILRGKISCGRATHRARRK